MQECYCYGHMGHFLMTCKRVLAWGLVVSVYMIKITTICLLMNWIIHLYLRNQSLFNNVLSPFSFFFPRLKTFRNISNHPINLRKGLSLHVVCTFIICYVLSHHQKPSISLISWDICMYELSDVTPSCFNHCIWNQSVSIKTIK